MPFTKTATIQERLEQLSIPEPNSGCWIWLGATTDNGYGRIAIGSRTTGDRALMGAHRASYQEHYGVTVPEGLFVCHRCDTPACINPLHLFLGTRSDNSRDMWKKGRAPSRAGEGNSQAKISSTVAGEIRRLHDAGISKRDIERRLSLSRGIVQGVCYGKTWAQVKP